MLFDWTISIGNLLTVVGFVGGGIFAVMALKNQVGLLAQRLARAEEDLSQLSALKSNVSEMKIKLDTMWEFAIRRAKAEAVSGGLATLNSPITFNANALKLVSMFAAPLQEFYAEIDSPKMTDAELMLEIERKFGERMLQEVCIPNHLSLGACLLIAVQIIRDGAGACHPSEH